MVSSAFLAEFLALYIVIVSAVFMIRHEAFSKYVEEFVEDTSTRYSVALVELAAGLGIVLTQNVWTLGYRGVITLIGWAMLAEAVFHLLANEEQEHRAVNALNHEKYWKLFGAASLLLGLYLLTRSFTAF